MHDLFGCHVAAISNHSMTGLEYDIVTNASWINIRVSKILRLQMNNPIRNSLAEDQASRKYYRLILNILLSEADFNKVLLDLEIYSLIRVPGLQKINVESKLHER